MERGARGFNSAGEAGLGDCSRQGRRRCSHTSRSKVGATPCDQHPHPPVQELSVRVSKEPLACSVVTQGHLPPVLCLPRGAPHLAHGLPATGILGPGKTVGGPPKIRRRQCGAALSRWAVPAWPLGEAGVAGGRQARSRSEQGPWWLWPRQLRPSREPGRAGAATAWRRRGPGLRARPCHRCPPPRSSASPQAQGCPKVERGPA